MVSEFRAIWTTPGGGGQSTFYTQGAEGQEQASATRIKAFLQDVAQGLTQSVTVNLDPEVRSLADVSGNLIGVTNINPGNAVVGTNNTQPVADASQVLFRWSTGRIHNGRRVAGRTFIPGLPVGSLAGGNLAAATVTDFASKLASFITATASDPLVVWHRPVNGAGGIAFSVTGGSVWPEIAVLRRRRG